MDAIRISFVLLFIDAIIIVSVRVPFSRSPSLESVPNNATVVYPSFFNTESFILISLELKLTFFILVILDTPNAVTDSIISNKSSITIKVLRFLLRCFLLFLAKAAFFAAVIFLCFDMLKPLFTCFYIYL